MKNKLLGFYHIARNKSIAFEQLFIGLILTFSISFLIFGFYITNSLKESKQIIAQQQAMITKYVQVTQDLSLPLLKLDSVINKLQKKSNGFTELLVLILVMGSSSVLLLRRLRKPLLDLEQEILNLSVNKNLSTTLVKRNNEYKVIVKATNKVIEKYNSALTDANNFIYHLYAMSAENISTISAVIAKLNKQNAETARVSASVSTVSGVARQVSNNLVKVSAAAISAQDKMHLSKELMLDLRKVIDAMAKDLQAACEAMYLIERGDNNIDSALLIINEVANVVNEVALGLTIEVAKNSENNSDLIKFSTKMTQVAKYTKDAAERVQNILDTLKLRVKETAYVTDGGSKKVQDSLVCLSKSHTTMDGAMAAIKNIQDTVNKHDRNGIDVESVQADIMGLNNLTKDSVLNAEHVAGYWRGILEIIRDYKAAVEFEEEV